MAKLHFFYSTMNAGKSTLLLQANHNYIENDHKTLLFIPEETALKSEGNIVSRIGLKAKATVANKNFNYFDYVNKHRSDDLSCILVDEAQFLSKKQVRELGKIADELNYPVMCYGIRTDFQGELFEGSSELLAVSDNLIELKASCRGINSPSPSALFVLYLATEIPITFPNLSNKGPPLFPGEIEASA